MKTGRPGESAAAGSVLTCDPCVLLGVKTIGCFKKSDKLFTDSDDILFRAGIGGSPFAGSPQCINGWKVTKWQQIKKLEDLRYPS